MLHLEGYCDGIAGRIMQERDRIGSYRETRDYINGFWLGCDDRETMLANNDTNAQEGR